MRVLDLGCGAGDVSLLAASIVGPSGSVTGVDMSADTVRHTQARIEGAKISNVTIEAGDITKLPYAGEFDAVIGRLILLYLGDPVAGMKAFRSYVKPGGLDLLPGILASRRRPRCRRCLCTTRPADGSRRRFSAATSSSIWGCVWPDCIARPGLPAPSMLGMARIETGPDSPAYEYLAQTIRSLLPLIERTGVATKEEVRHRHARGAHARGSRGGQCGRARARAHRRLDARPARITFV